MNIVLHGIRDPRTEKLVRADQATRSGPQSGPDLDQQNFWKNGPERTTDQGKFENADWGGPRTSVIKNRGPRELEKAWNNLNFNMAYT